MPAIIHSKLRLICCLIFFIMPPLGVQAGQVELIETFAADPTVYTQGLALNAAGDLIVNAGQYGKSRIGYLRDGKLINAVPLAEDEFAEGIAVVSYESQEAVWQLTWQEERAYLRAADDLKVLKQVDYDGEGWGLCYDGDRDLLWMTNGSDRLQQRDPQIFDLIQEIAVTDSGKPVDKYDMSPIIEDAQAHYTANHGQPADIDVLNGIEALGSDRFLVGGKHYPWLFKVSLLSDSIEVSQPSANQ